MRYCVIGNWPIGVWMGIRVVLCSCPLDDVMSSGSGGGDVADNPPYYYSTVRERETGFGASRSVV